MLGADVIPRLSIESVEDLRNSVLEMIYRIKIPKYQVFRAPRQQNDETLLAEVNANTLYEESEPIESDFKKQVEAFHEFQTSLKERDQDRYIRMHTPGRILHLLHLGENQSDAIPLPYSRSNLKGRQQLSARWSKRQDFQRVLISPHLLFDHDPVNVKNQLRDLASKFGLEPPYCNVLPQDC